MIKLFRRVVLLLSILTLFSSCGNYSNRDALIMMSTYIPGFDFSAGYDIITEPLETDAQGRVLFLLKNNLNDLTAFVIIQKWDSKYIFYYEDVNYTYVDPIDGTSLDINSRQIADLKLKNDWGKALEQNKMSRRKTCIYITNVIDKKIPKHESFEIKSIKATLCEKLGYSDESSIEIELEDFDNTSLLFCALRVREDYDKCDNYYAIFSISGDSSFLLVDDLFCDSDKIHEFKQEHSWNFYAK